MVITATKRQILLFTSYCDCRSSADISVVSFLVLELLIKVSLTRPTSILRLLFGVNEKKLTQQITNISCCKSATRVGQELRLGLGLDIDAAKFQDHLHLKTDV